MLGEGISTSSVNKPDKNGVTPLMHATIAESEVVMKLLLKYGGSTSIQIKNNDGATPLHFAASGNYFIVVSVCSYDGLYVVLDGSVSRLDLLVSNSIDCDLNALSGSGAPLHWAAGKGTTSELKIIITS